MGGSDVTGYFSQFDDITEADKVKLLKGEIVGSAKLFLDNAIYQAVLQVFYYKCDCYKLIVSLVKIVMSRLNHKPRQQYYIITSYLSKYPLELHQHKQAKLTTPL